MGETEQGLEYAVTHPEVAAGLAELTTEHPEVGREQPVKCPLKLKAQPVPVWTPHSHEYLEGIANNGNLDFLADSGSSITCTGFQGTIPSLVNPRKHTGGRTSSRVQDSNGHFVEVAPGEYRRVRINYTWKVNNDPKLNEIELLFYRELENRGVKVIKAVESSGRIVLTHMETTLNKFLAQLVMDSCDPQKAIETFSDLSYGVMDIAAKASYVADDILWKNPEYGKYLKQRSLESLAEQFGVDMKTAEERFYLLIMLKAIPSEITEQQIKIYEPLEKLLKESSEVLGAVDLDIKPGHLFVAQRDGKPELLLHDFNHVEHYSIFSVMARCIDAFIPIQKRMQTGDGSSLPMFWGTYEYTSPYTPNEKMQMCGAYMKTWGEVTGADAESVIKNPMFAVYIQAWRFRHNAMQALLGLYELAEADNYRAIYTKSMYVNHHLGNAFEAAANLDHWDRAKGGSGIFAPMAEDLEKTLGTKFRNIVPDEVRKAAIKWMDELK